MIEVEIQIIEPILIDLFVGNEVFLVPKTIPIKGDKGEPGDGAIVDLELAVTINGQTKFNVFTMPSGWSVLIINGTEYHRDTDYTLTPSMGNIDLDWINTDFTLQIGDELIFRKF
jgi:hypothetical protein